MNNWVEIDLNAIRYNIKTIKKLIDWPKIKLMPVVKANAYGHGAIEISKILQLEKVDYLAVATFNEAMQLRNNKIKLPILIIGYIDKSEIEEAIKNNITLSIYDLKEAVEIKKICQKLNKKAKVHLKLDSGMHRLGFMPEDFIYAYKKLLKDDCLEIEYIYSHFADVANSDYRNYQMKVLSDILNDIEKEKLLRPKIHFSRSDALTDKETFFDMVRPGLATYGITPIKGLKPALSFKTKIVQIKNIKKGDYVGYSLTFRAPRDMKIATIAVGYADGYGRNLSNRGRVIVAGKRCPVIGRVCMNLTIIDVSKLSNIKIGDEVVLIGKSGKEEMTAFELAQKIDTIPYEIVARIPAEIPRIYNS